MFGIATAVAVIGLVRSLLLQFVVPPDSLWNLARIGLGFLVYALTARLAIALAGRRLSVVAGAVALLLPIAIVGIARLELGFPPTMVLAGIVTAVAGGAAGAAIGEMVSNIRFRTRD